MSDRALDRREARALRAGDAAHDSRPPPLAPVAAVAPVALSVVVPAYDEAANLARLVDEVRSTLDDAGISWELIVVDDGSADETPEVLARLAAADDRVRPLRLAVRSGQTAALVAGFRAAAAPLIATLDADLQCPPRELPALLRTLGDADLACGVRTARRDPLRRRLVSALTNGARRCLLAPRVRDLACPLRVFRAAALARVEAMTPLFDGAHRWLPALFVLAGLRVAQRRVTHQPRRAGVSKYTATGRALPVARELVRVLRLAFGRSRALRAAAAVAAVAALALLFVYRIDAWPLTEPDEGRNAEVAREMLQLRTWSVPSFNHLPYLDKPVLLFWLMAAFFRTLGVNELAARLPSALAAIGTVGVTFATARALLDARRAVVAAVALATMPLVLVFARAAIFDLPLTLAVSAALLCLLQARRTGDVWIHWPLAGLAMGLGVLCKGPVGIAVPVLAWLAGRGALPPMPRRPPRAAALASVAVVAALVVPWLALVHRAEPDFLRYALVDETFLRMTTARGFHRAGPPYYYLTVLAWAAGVWGVLALALAPALARRRRRGGSDGAAIAFAARALAAIVVFFSLLASKRPQYILPALVPLAVLVAAGIDAEPRRAARILRAVAAAVLPVGVVAIAVGRAGFTPAHGPLRVVTPELAVTTGLVLGVWALVTLVAARRPAATVACAALLMPTLGLLLLGPVRDYAESRSAREIARHVPADANVIAFDTFRTGLPFYLGRPVVLVSRDWHELTSRYVMATRDRLAGSAYLRAEGDLAAVIAATPHALVLTTRPQREIEERTGRRFVVVYAHRRDLLLRPAG